MMVHVLSGQWPFPGEAVRVNPRNPNDPNDLVGVTEFDRREEYINKIGDQHPLMRLIQLCLSNSSSHRPTSLEVHQQVSAVAADHPPSFANRVVMLERIKVLGEENETMRIKKNNAVAKKETAVVEREQVLAELEETQFNMDRLQQSHSIQVEGVQLEVSDLKAEIEQLQTVVKTKERELEVNKCNHQEEIEAIKIALQKEYQTQLDSKASELSSKDALIFSKSSTIQSLQEKLGQALGTSSSKDSLNVFSPGVKLNFTECAELPSSGGGGQAIVVGKVVYVKCGGNVFKYCITEDTCRTLPEPPVTCFSIVYLHKKIVLVGGMLRFKNQVTGDINEFDEASQQWVRSTSIPPMPTARQGTTAVSWTTPTALIVCGGSDKHNKPMNVVEVYHSKTSQWHAVSPLPFPRYWMTHTVIHDVLCLVSSGGGQAIVVGKVVYVKCGGNVFKYCITEDTCRTLPEPPVTCFSIVYLHKKIVLVGGMLRFKNQVTGDINEFDEASQQWVRSTSIPPMPTARQGTTAVSWTTPTALIVCGGSDKHNKPMNVVEVYHSKTSQWHAVSPLPFPRSILDDPHCHSRCALFSRWL